MGNATQEAVEKRQQKLTRTIMLLVLINVVCNVPQIILMFSYALTYSSLSKDANSCISDWVYTTGIIYNSQCGLNIFIYAGSNEQYRSAFIYYWKSVVFKERDKMKFNFLSSGGNGKHVVLHYIRMCLNRIWRSTSDYTI